MENVFGQSFAGDHNNTGQIGVIVAGDLAMICSPSLTLYTSSSTPSTSPSASASSRSSLSFPNSVSIPSPQSAFVPLIKPPAPAIPLLLSPDYGQNGEQGGNLPCMTDLLAPFGKKFKQCNRSKLHQAVGNFNSSSQTSVIVKPTTGQMRRIRRRKQKPTKLTAVVRRHTINLGESRELASTQQHFPSYEDLPRKMIFFALSLISDRQDVRIKTSNVANSLRGSTVIVTAAQNPNMGLSSFGGPLYLAYSTSPGTDSSGVLPSPAHDSGNVRADDADDERQCLVCGDKATGYNFNVITCEACKAFFRRNARKVLKCSYDNNCAVNESIRRTCRKCRLDKCLRVGMIKEWILSDEQLLRRKKPKGDGRNKSSSGQQIHKRRGGKSLDIPLQTSGGKSLAAQQPSVGNISHSAPSLNTVTCFFPFDGDTDSRTVIRSPTGSISSSPGYLGEGNASVPGVAMRGRAFTIPPAAGVRSTASYSQSAPFTEYSSHRDMADLFIGSRIESHLADASLLPLVMNEDDIYQLIHLDLNDPYTGGADIDFSYVMNGSNAHCPIVEQQDFSLSDEHQREVELVRSAHACMEEREADSVMKPVIRAMLKEEHTPLDVMNVMDFTIRKCVKMALRIPYFNELTIDSKTQLMKASMISLLTVRGVERLNVEKEGFHSPALFGSKANISITKLFRKLADPDQEKRLMRFYESLEAQTRKDPTAMALITVAVLFSSHAFVMNVSEKGKCKGCHDAYINLLARYLGSIHRERGATMMRSVMNAVRQLPSISTRASVIFAGKIEERHDEGNDLASRLSLEFFKTEETARLDATIREQIERAGNPIRPDQAD